MTPHWKPTDLPLNEKLLKLIAVVKSYAEHRMDFYQFFGTPGDWRKDTESFYESIDDTTLEALGLAKNQMCFDAILRFNITDDISNTEYCNLGKFKLAI